MQRGFSAQGHAQKVEKDMNCLPFSLGQEFWALKVVAKRPNEHNFLVTLNALSYATVGGRRLLFAVLSWPSGP